MESVTIQKTPTAYEVAPVKGPERLLELAIEKGADVSQLTQLLDLQQRWDAEQARKAYFIAKAKFQSLCPAIDKDKTVKFGNTEYKHASLPHIANTIRDVLAQCGLSYDWKFSDSEGGLTATCVLSHVDGHSESNAMTAPADDSGSKNIIQQLGSTSTYLQRYTLIGALGLTTADEDDDGRATGEQNTELLRKHNEALRNNFLSVYVVKQAIADKDFGIASEAWGELTQDEQRALWVAPTKGGIFTTDERATMKSDEWAEARRLHNGS